MIADDLFSHRTGDDSQGNGVVVMRGHHRHEKRRLWLTENEGRVNDAYGYIALGLRSKPALGTQVIWQDNAFEGLTDRGIEERDPTAGDSHRWDRVERSHDEPRLGLVTIERIRPVESDREDR